VKIEALRRLSGSVLDGTPHSRHPIYGGLWVRRMSKLGHYLQDGSL
jgi:hypothetical protein